MYFIVNRITRETIRVTETPFNVDETVQPEDNSVIQLKQVDDETVPTYNVANQKLVRVFVDDDEAFTRTFKLEVSSLTNGELAAKTLELQDQANRVIVKNSISALIAGTGTQAERLARLEKAVAHLARFEVRF